MAFYGTLTDPLFRPAVINILSITQSFPAVVTTTYDGVVPASNGYISGLIVRLIIPSGFGMELLNKSTGEITVINANSFSIPFDTTNMDAFVIPALEPGHHGTAAQVNAYGQEAHMTSGSFTNVFQQRL